jgi:hypothetical protein
MILTLAMDRSLRAIRSFEQRELLAQGVGRRRAMRQVRRDLSDARRRIRQEPAPDQPGRLGGWA